MKRESPGHRLMMRTRITKNTDPHLTTNKKRTVEDIMINDDGRVRSAVVVDVVSAITIIIIIVVITITIITVITIVTLPSTMEQQSTGGIHRIITTATMPPA